MKFYRRILRIPCTEGAWYEQILEKNGNKKKTYSKFKEEETWTYNEEGGLKNLIITGHIEGKKMKKGSETHIWRACGNG